VKDLELGMLVVGAVSLAAAAIVVASTAVHLRRGGEGEGRAKVLLAASQAGLLTPLGLLLFSYVYSWADMPRVAYALAGVAAFAISGAGLVALQRNAAR
jgi:hypothetical protein